MEFEFQSGVVMVGLNARFRLGGFRNGPIIILFACCHTEETVSHLRELSVLWFVVFLIRFNVGYVSDYCSGDEGEREAFTECVRLIKLDVCEPVWRLLSSLILSPLAC